MRGPLSSLSTNYRTCNPPWSQPCTHSNFDFQIQDTYLSRYDLFQIDFQRDLVRDGTLRKIRRARHGGDGAHAHSSWPVGVRHGEDGDLDRVR